MSTNITFVATLRDQVSGPTRKVTQSIESLERATNQAAITTGRYTDAQGRLREANGRFVSSSDRARASTQRQIGTTRVLGSTWENTGRRLIGGATGAYKAASAVDRLTQRLGISEAMGKRFSIRVAQTLLRLPGQAGNAATGFGSAMTRLSGYATSASQRIQSAMNKVGTAVALATTAVATASVVGGVNRLTALESADVKLDTMGYSEPERAGIMTTVDEAVTGTPFALNEAATGAAQYLAAGVSPEDLGKRLGTTVDMAGIYDMQLGDASLIMSKVLATGTLQGDEVMQLQERGMPVYKALSEHLGVEQGDVKGLISEGKVTAEDFFDAIAPTVEGGAEKLGNTWKGRFANLRTALSRSAATALTPLMDPTKELFTGLTQVLKDAQPFFKGIGESLAPGIALAAEKAPQLAAALAPLGPPLLELFRVAGDALPGLISGLTTWARILAPIAGFFIRIGAAIAEFVGPHLSWLVPLILGFGALSTTIFGVTIAMIGFKVLRFVAPLMLGITRAVWASSAAMKVLGGAARLAGLAFKFMFPATSLAAKGILLVGRAILASPLLWVPLAIFAVIKGLEYLYNNSELVRQGFDGIGNAVRGVLGFFDDLVGKISDLIEDKFPRLHKAATDALNFGSGKETGQGGSTIGDVVMGGGARLGQALGLPDVGGNRDALIGAPRHANGGWTASGAHAAIVGEEGREFVVPHYASEKLASIPGALGAIHQGKVPVRPVPVPVGGGGAGSVSFGDIYVTTPATDGEEFARQFAAEFPRHYRAATARDARTKELTNSTLTARGAR